MKLFRRNLRSIRKTTRGLAALTIAAGLALPALIGNAEAAGRAGGAKAPGPRAAAITTPGRIDRNNQQVIRAPTKAYNDKRCQQPHPPIRCRWPHPH